MSTTIKKYFDEEYEYQILKCVIGDVVEDSNGKKLRDTRYGESIIGLLDPKYFSTSFLKKIVDLIKHHYSLYRTIPSYREIKAQAQLKLSSSIEKEALVDELIRIANLEIKPFETLKIILSKLLPKTIDD